MKLFNKIIKKNFNMILIHLLSGIIISLLSALTVYYFQQLLDNFNKHALTVSTITIYGILSVVLCLINYFDNYPGTKLQNSIYLYFKLHALKKISTLDYLHYQKIGFGKLIQQIENGAAAGKNILYEFYFRLIRELIPNALISLIFIGLINVYIMLFVLAGYFIVYFITKMILKYLYSVKKNILVNEEFLNKNLVRGLTELVVFRINRRYDYEIKKSENSSDSITDSKTKLIMIHESFFTIFALLVILIKIMVIVFSLLKPVLTVGKIVALISYLDNAYGPIAIFNVLFVQYKLNRITFERYYEILKMPDDKNLYSGDIINCVKGDISFDNVDFSYERRQVFQNLSFNISKNSISAFVGESGSGKSTVIKLITGLIKPDTGKITVDDNDLSNINLNIYYKYISYTPQESPVFDGTLKENIVFDNDVPDQDIINVLHQVGLKDFYDDLPNKLDTQIGEKGIMISGGERQRIALARVFFQNAKIIILDEATSALDNLTEEYVIKNMIRNLKDKTFIIVAHRLNSIRKADNIFVMKHGKIVGNGSFEYLLKSNDYFKKLLNTNILQ